MSGETSATAPASEEDLLHRLSGFMSRSFRGSSETGDADSGRQQASVELCAAQEAISVKSLIDFRERRGVPSSEQSVIAAAVCLVANIDDAVQLSAQTMGAIPWEVAQAMLGKPGHFLNSLRRFPYVVDSGRLPGENLVCSRHCLENVPYSASFDSEGVVRHIHRWVLAAWRYCEAPPSPTAAGSSVMPPVPTFMGPPLPRAPALSETSAPPGAAKAAAAVGSSSTARSPGKQVRTSLEGSRVSRTSVGAKSSPGSDGSTPKPARTSASSSVAPVGSASANSPAEASQRRSQAGHIPQQGSGRGATRRVPGTPPGAAASQMSTSPSLVRPRLSGATSEASAAGRGAAGYPRGAIGSVGDPRRIELERIRRETQRMKGMENQLKWNMKRQETLQKKAEQKMDAQNEMESQQLQQRQMRESMAEIKEVQKQTELQEGFDFVDFKRADKVLRKEEEQQQVTEMYTDSKENSQWSIQVKKITDEQRHREIVEEGLENLKTIVTYKIEAQQQEDAELQFARRIEEEQQMDHQMLLARQERDLALQSLEHVRAQEHAPVLPGAHLPAGLK